MSKAAWFENYERLYAERGGGEISDDVTDEELADMATEAVKDQMADRADQINDEKWEREYDFSKGVRGKYTDKGEKA